MENGAEALGGYEEALGGLFPDLFTESGIEAMEAKARGHGIPVSDMWLMAMMALIHRGDEIPFPEDTEENQ
jgi:hypothetical protein